MPINAIKVRPGVNADLTPTLNEAGISESNLIRFKDGVPQKLGGWTKFYPFTIGSTVRALHAWQDINIVKHLGVGAEASLNVITDGIGKDITPLKAVVDYTPDFSTTSGSAAVSVAATGSNTTTFDAVFFNTQVSVGGLILQGAYPITTGGTDVFVITAAALATSTVANGGDLPIFDSTIGSATVTVTFPNHGLSVGGTAEFLVSTTVGGIPIFGVYTVTAVNSADEYEIIAANTASSTDTQTMNGGDVQFAFYYTENPSAEGVGYGIGGYGLGGYGTGITPPPTPGTPITATDWTLDNWGEVFVACPVGGPLYTWTPSAGLGTAQAIATGPFINGGMFVAMPERILVAWGSTFTGIQDPLLVRWSDVSDFNTWIARSTNQAGSFRLSTGSRIVGALQAPQQALLWTDIDLWAMQYQGQPFVFGFNKIASVCGLIGLHAMGILTGTVYWMGQTQFYSYGGGGSPAPMDCPVWDVVFQDLDTDNAHKIRCAPNSNFSEIAWFYPSLSGGTGEIDKYVKFNPRFGWDYGSLARTAWIDQSVLGPPIGAGTTAYIYQHETSNDADGAAMNSSFKTGYAMISEGTQQTFIDWVFPDFNWRFYASASPSASVQITLYTTDYPDQTPVAHGPFTVSQAVSYFTPRVRGRQVAVKIESNDLGSFWRLGNVRYRGAADGRR